MTDGLLTPAQEAVSELVRSDSHQGALGAIRVSFDPGGLAPAIGESYQHARSVAEAQDISISLYRLPFGGSDIYVIMLIPDGNDGWFEAYTAAGALVGAGQFIGRRVAWADPAEVRACAVATSLQDSTLPALRHQLGRVR